MTSTFVSSQPLVGRSRTGDQLHACSLITRDEDGVLKTFISNNAHCNQRMRLNPVGRVDDKVQIKFRPGLFCVKCFGAEPKGNWANAELIRCEEVR